MEIKTTNTVTLAETPDETVMVKPDNTEVSGYEVTIIIPEYGEAEVFTTHDISDMEIGATSTLGALFDDSNIFVPFKRLFDSVEKTRVRLRLTTA